MIAPCKPVARTTKSARRIKPTRSHAELLVGDARIAGKRFRAEAPIHALIKAKKH